MGWEGRSPNTDGVELPAIGALKGAITIVIVKEIDPILSDQRRVPGHTSIAAG